MNSTSVDNRLDEARAPTTGKRDAKELVAGVLSTYSAANKKLKTESRKIDNAATVSIEKSNKSNETETKKETAAVAKEPSPADELIDIEKAQYTFPERLMELLGNDSVKEALWWLPGEEAFALMPSVFYDIVLAKYFQGTKFESFTRKLNRWGFKRLSGQGVPKGAIAYYHKMFKKEKPEMAKKMRSGKNSQSQDEPNNAGLSAYALDQAIQFNPMFAAQMSTPATTTIDPTALLLAQAQAQHAGLGASLQDKTSLQLRLLQQHINQEAAKQLSSMQQILAQEQQNAQINALVQLGGASSDIGQKTGLFGVNDIRTVQEAALAQAQLRARVFQGNSSAPAGLGIGNTTQGIMNTQQQQPSEDQIRLALLRQHLANQGGIW